MATRRIFSCDRCGEEWEEENHDGFVNYPRHLDYEPLRKMDLCPECELEFYELIKAYEEVHRDGKTEEGGAG